MPLTQAQARLAAASAWGAIVAVNRNLPAKSAVLKGVQALANEFRPHVPTLPATIAVDGRWGPTTASVCAQLVMLATADMILLTESGVASLLSTAPYGVNIDSTSKLSSTFGRLDAAVSTLSARTTLARGFKDWAQSALDTIGEGTEQQLTRRYLEAIASNATTTPATPVSQGAADSKVPLTTAAAATKEATAGKPQYVSPKGTVTTVTDKGQVVVDDTRATPANMPATLDVAAQVPQATPPIAQQAAPPAPRVVELSPGETITGTPPSLWDNPNLKIAIPIAAVGLGLVVFLVATKRKR